ncbi:MAG: hypothetical protein K0S14_1227 [Thermomicrobiales bacterium]|jgi:hypothetical protein|nr:hypothetical protein [Thermomicrobiales bacterium]
MANDQGTPSAPAPATEALDTDSAASLLERLLPSDWEENGVSELQAEDASADAPATPAPDAPKAEDEEESEETQDDADEPEEPTPPAPQKVKVGDQEYTLEELEKSILRHADYTRKTQAVAEDRKILETAKAETAAERTKYLEGLKQYEKSLQELVPTEPNWDAIKAQHPEKFAEAVAEWTLIKQEREKVASEIAAAEAKQAEERRETFQKHVDAEYTRLLEVLPEFKEPATVKALMKYATEVAGFTPEQVQSVADHRLMMILYKASQYDLAKATKKGEPVPATPTGTKKTPVLQPGATPPSSPSSSRDRRVREAVAAARKSGKVDDAARAFQQMLPEDFLG